MTELERSPNTVTLRYRRDPGSRGMMIAIGLCCIAAIALFGVYRLYATGPANPSVPAIVILVLGVAAIGALLWRPSPRSVTSVFDLETRVVRVTAEFGRGADAVETMAFDETEALRLLRQTSQRSRVETLTLARQTGGAIFLAEESQLTPAEGDYSLPLLDLAEAIRNETGIKGPDPVPGAIGAMGKMIGTERL